MTKGKGPRHIIGGNRQSCKTVIPIPAHLAPGALDVRGSGEAYAVYLGPTRITAFFGSWSAANSAASTIEERSRQTKRPCITCGKTMLSTGPHHRMCTACRSAAEKMA